MNEIRFQHNVPDVCTMFVLTSDLGNNGLPLQYIGDPPYGVEVPFLGIDFDRRSRQPRSATARPSTRRSRPIGASACPKATRSTSRSPSPTIPAIASRASRVRSHAHAPPAQARYAGHRAAGRDLQRAPSPITVPGGQRPRWTSRSRRSRTPLVDGEPHDRPDRRSAGYAAVRATPSPSATPTVTVTIIDDDVALGDVSIGDVTKAEGNSGTTDFTFPVTLSAPAPIGDGGRRDDVERHCDDR